MLGKDSTNWICSKYSIRINGASSSLGREMGTQKGEVYSSFLAQCEVLSGQCLPIVVLVRINECSLPSAKLVILFLGGGA